VTIKIVDTHLPVTRRVLCLGKREDPGDQMKFKENLMFLS
jgi:hypothetical protein